MREMTVDCAVCGERTQLNRAKEAFFETGANKYHVMDLCPTCLDAQLQKAESVNDTDGFRQKAAVLVKLPNSEVPQRGGQPVSPRG